MNFAPISSTNRSSCFLCPLQLLEKSIDAVSQRVQLPPILSPSAVCLTQQWPPLSKCPLGLCNCVIGSVEGGVSKVKVRLGAFDSGQSSCCSVQELREERGEGVVGGGGGGEGSVGGVEVEGDN